MVKRHRRTKSALAHAGEGCRPQRGKQRLWQYARQVNKRCRKHSCLYTTALQGCFPKLSHCLINSSSVIRTTAVKMSQHMLQRQRVQVLTNSLTAACTYTEPQLPGHTLFFTVTASPSLRSL